MAGTFCLCVCVSVCGEHDLSEKAVEQKCRGRGGLTAPRCHQEGSTLHSYVVLALPTCFRPCCRPSFHKGLFSLVEFSLCTALCKLLQGAHMSMTMEGCYAYFDMYTMDNGKVQFQNEFEIRSVRILITNVVDPSTLLAVFAGTGTK